MPPKTFLSYGAINEKEWAAAVAYLRQKVSAKDRRRIATEMRARGLDTWVMMQHLFFGMSVRNMLRRGGFTESKLGVLDLDTAWGYLLCEAVDGPSTESHQTEA